MKKLLWIVVLFLLFACGEKKESNETAVAQKVEIKGQWMTPSVTGMNSAMFFHIINNTDNADTLYAVESDIADASLLHETFTNDDGTTGMRHVEFVAVPPHSDIEFKPGGRHVMMIYLHADQPVGDTVAATLQFKKAGDITLQVPVEGMH